jgi:hypothetical protein
MTTDPSWYELRNSVFSRDFGHAGELLAANPGLFDLTNSIGETVLHFLAVENDAGGVAWLHARGFSLNTNNRFGEPMVSEVAALGHKDLLLWLGRHGADLSVVDGKQRSILEYLRKNKDEKRKRADEEMVQFLVDKFSF